MPSRSRWNESQKDSALRRDSCRSSATRLDKLFPQAPTGRTGSTRLNVLPLRGALSTVTSPPSSRARLLLTLTPSPVPPVAHASPLNEVLPFQSAALLELQRGNDSSHRIHLCFPTSSRTSLLPVASAVAFVRFRCPAVQTAPAATSQCERAVHPVPDR